MISQNYTKKELVNFVHHQYSQGTTQAQIAQMLNENQIPTVSKKMISSSKFEYIPYKKWQRHTIAAILKTKQYNPPKKKYNAQSILKKLRKVHNNEYEYPDYTRYISTTEKITVVCSKHGKFYPTINAHLKGSKCNRCMRESTPQHYLKRANGLHNHFYEYDLTGYQNTNDSTIRIKCPTHGWFEMNAGYHVQQKGRCIQCIKEEQHLSHHEILLRAKNVHNNYYKEYDLSETTNIRSNIKVKCPKHGWFTQNLHSHINNGSGCPTCRMSKGEKKIMRFISMSEWLHEHSFSDCQDKGKLRFDFYSPKHNTAIEYQGAQHYKPIENLGGQEHYENVVRRDRIKKQYCKHSGIKLICIHYKDYNKIEEILKDNNLHRDQTLDDLGISFL